MCKVHIKGHGKLEGDGGRDSYTLLPVKRISKSLIYLL